MNYLEVLDNTQVIYSTKVLRLFIEDRLHDRFNEEEWTEIKRLGLNAHRVKNRCSASGKVKRRTITELEGFFIWVAAILVYNESKKIKNFKQALKNTKPGHVFSVVNARATTEDARMLKEAFSPKGRDLLTWQDILNHLEKSVGIPISESLLRNLGHNHKQCPRFLKNTLYTPEQLNHFRKYVLRSRYYRKINPNPDDLWTA